MWEYGEAGIYCNIMSVFAIDEKHVLAVGSADRIGFIMRSEDGGLTWDFENPSTSESFNVVYFKDRYNGWIIGRGNVLLKTTDGGNEWTPQNLPYRETLRSIFFIDRLNDAEVASGRFRQDLFFPAARAAGQAAAAARAPRGHPAARLALRGQARPQDQPTRTRRRRCRARPHHGVSLARQRARARERDRACSCSPRATRSRPQRCRSFCRAAPRRIDSSVPRELTLPEILDDLERQLIPKATRRPAA